MIYAFGPGNRLQSNALDAPLKRHVRYGKFTMNMVAATGNGGVPEPSTVASGVEMKGGMTRDHDRANLAHAVLGCLAIFVFWPLNVIFAGFFKRIQIHLGISIFIMVFLVAAYGLGIATSSEYNRVSSTLYLFLLHKHANRMIVQRLPLPPPNFRLPKHCPHPRPFNPPNPANHTTLSTNPAPPRSTHISNPHLPGPNRRSRPASLLAVYTYNTRLYRRISLRLRLLHTPPSMH